MYFPAQIGARARSFSRIFVLDRSDDRSIITGVFKNEHLSIFALLGPLLATLACDRTTPPTPFEARGAREDAHLARKAAVSEAAPLRRGLVLGGERVDRAPEWASFGVPDDSVRLSLEADVLAAVDRASAPVLAPRAWSVVKVIPLAKAGFSLIARDGDAKLVLQSSKIAHLYEDLPSAAPRAEIRGVAGTLTVNEGIRSASWVEGGVAYTADLECGDAEAPACASDEGFSALLEGLVYVGGAAPSAVAPGGAS